MITATATLGAPCLALLADDASAARRGVQRNYAGARWSETPRALGWYATLRLEKAFADDWSAGGFIAQTLWTATNEGKTAYGRNRRTPYVQVALSRGWRGRDLLALVIAQRTANGRYYEGRARVDVSFGGSYNTSLLNECCGIWHVRFSGNEVATARGAGKRFGSRSAFAGIESSSGDNHARGEVKDLWWLTDSGRSVAPLPRWRVETHHDQGAKLVRRGPGRVRWTDDHWALRNSFGR